MKNKLFTASVLCFVIFAVLVGPSLKAQDIVRVLISITNAPATDADDFDISGDTRTWKDTITDATTQIQTDSDIGQSATNVFEHIAANPFSSQWTLSMPLTNQVQITFLPGATPSASVTTGTWGEISQSTNTVTALTMVEVPMSSLQNSVRTNIATLLVTGLDSYAQSPASQTATWLGEYVSLEQSQSVSNKTFFSTILSSPTTTNLVNYGNAISSPGSGTVSEQFGYNSDASGQNGVAVGHTSTASGLQSTAVGYGNTVAGDRSVGLGASVTVAGDDSVGIGKGVTVSSGSTNSVVIGYGSSSSTYTNAIVLGANRTITADNQMLLGNSANIGIIAGTLQVSTGITNTTIGGITLVDMDSGYWSNGGATNLVSTNMTTSAQMDVGGDIAFQRNNHSTLANGNNAGVDFGEYVFVKIEAGPSAAFTVNGIANGRDGKMYILYNSTGQNMTIANQSGVDATAANRIITMTGSDVSSTGNCSATLIYDSEDSRWILTNFQD